MARERYPNIFRSARLDCGNSAAITCEDGASVPTLTTKQSIARRRKQLVAVRVQIAARRWNPTSF
jgi:hypothetical protein